ncbi:competence protein CoiA family protein [Ruminococcus flavefaciens]|uniref:competence protein CoiA family protein n=1 Tax=Ruminococcus flavefaciens TaxID=1265 RepID=UPI0026E99E20|nr:competence protein CoiA family protein [Ruminococcus flavefaciens]
MYIALNSNFIRTHIDDASSNNDYFCPFCKAPLDLRRGDIRRHHFAHAKHHLCTDTWSRDRSENDSTWHKQWQEHFPINNQEIPLQLGEIKHRADVMIDRTVLEFQHSPLSPEKFSDRNVFYAGLGHKVIWIFDCMDVTFSQREDFYYWTRPKRTFRNYSDIARANQTELYFQIDENTLVRVTDISPEGFECFQGYQISVSDFINSMKLQNGCFPVPEPEDFNDNPTYLGFKKKYDIDLNKQQERAVQSITGANLLLAVPGSGKTTVLITRIGYMIHCKNIAPESILALTYTTKAAAEMEARYKAKFGDDGVTFKTINAIAEAIIRFYCDKEDRKRFVLLSESEKKKYMRKAYKDVTDEFPTEAEIKQLATEITRVKNNSDLQEMDAFTPDFERIKARYDALLTNDKKMDFDDQILYSIIILKKFPYIKEHYKKKYKYICVDEAQDTSKKQHELIYLLVGDNIFMVGDEDQSIYSFRGAFPRALTNFEQNYPNPYILRMETNYRSYKEITDLANKFIARNFNRNPKQMLASRNKGGITEVITYKNRAEEYEMITDICSNIQEETAVLYRDSDCAINLVAKLIKNNISFNLLQNSTTFFSNRKVINVLALIEFYLDQKNFDAFLKIYYLFGFKKEAAEKLVRYCKYNNKSVSEATSSNKMTCILDTMNQETVHDTVLRAALHVIRTDDTQVMRRYSDVLALLGGNVETIKEYVPYINNLRENIASYENKSNVPLTLSTIHSAKGMEFKNVIIMDVYEGVMPKTSMEAIEENEDKKDLYQEERRLFYVAVTRAKDKLSIVRLSNERCSFVDELFGTERIAPCPLRNLFEKRNKEPLIFPTFQSNLLFNNAFSNDESINENMESGLNEVIIDGLSFKVGESVIHCYIGEGTIKAFTYIEGSEIILVHIQFKNRKDKFSLENCIKNGTIAKKV